MLRSRAAYLRAHAADERERKRLYAESRAAEVAAKNDDLEAEVADLQGLLAGTLRVNDQINFSSLRKPAIAPPWRHAELEKLEPPPIPDSFKPAQPTGLSKVFGKAKYEQAFEEGRVRYERAVQEHGHGNISEPQPWRRPARSGRRLWTRRTPKRRSSMSR